MLYVLQTSAIMLYSRKDVTDCKSPSFLHLEVLFQVSEMLSFAFSDHNCCRRRSAYTKLSGAYGKGSIRSDNDSDFISMLQSDAWRTVQEVILILRITLFGFLGTVFAIIQVLCSQRPGVILPYMYQ